MGVTPIALRGRRPATIDDVLARTDLSRAQFLMWLGQEIDPDIPLYNMIQTFRIEGPLDIDRFAEAWQDVVTAADALHTTVVAPSGVPRLVVDPAMVAPVEVVDLRRAADPEGALGRWIDARKVVPLRLDVRLWDTALVRVTDDITVWYLCQHHLVTDGQSFAVVYRAMAERYALALEGRLAEASPLPAYKDYLEHERAFRAGDAFAKASGYWQARARTTGERTAFYGRTVTGRSARTDRVLIDLGPERTRRLREVAATPAFAALSQEQSLHAIWATVLATALHRITGQDHVRVGSPFLGRPTRAFRDTVGLFIEIGVLEAAIDADDTFATLAARMRAELLQGMLHAKPGISSAELNRSYDVLLNSVTSRFADFAGLPVSTDWVHTGFGDRDHALRLQVTDFDDRGAIRLYADVNAELFGPVERTWLVDQLLAVLDAFLDRPDRPLGSFDLLTDDQRRHQVDDFNDTDAEYPRDLTVVDLFERQVAATPDAVAVEDAGGALSYAELHDAADRLARRLHALGARPGELVAICTPRSNLAVVAILGVLRTGAAYVPVDPDYPAARRQLMIDDADPVAVITAGTDAEAGGRPVIDLARDEPGSDDRPREPVATRPRPDDVAYVIYTSGSTGRPKGTVLSHQGLVNYLWWARDVYQDGEVLDFPLYSSLSFDLTITSLFVPLITGGRVVVYGASRAGRGLEVIDVFTDDRVDIVKLTPAHLGLLREHGIECTRIRRLIVGGENFLTELARAVGAAFDHDVAIFNEYGPTETVVGCMIHRFDEATDVGPSVPIGRPAANARIHVLDRYDQPVPPGVVGEMVISSDGVALGYRNQPELTAERFGDDPTRPGARRYRTGDLARWGADGRLEFLGRADHQVKIRGARIELGEIESAISAHPGVDAVVVDVVTLAGGDGGPLVHCRTCGLPSNYPDAGIDDTGECADCRAYARHRDDVARYFRTADDLAVVLDDLKARRADQPYDAIVLVSGGKDSTYMLYQLVREQGLRPLVFTLDNGFISPAAIENIRAACADLGVDLHIGSTPHMNAIFADSLERHSNVCNGCYKTIYTLSMSLARQHGIDTIITGLARGQLFETRLADTFAARQFDPAVIDEWIIEARKAYHHIDDAVYQLLERDLFRDDSIFDAIGFLDYYRYVDVDLDEVYAYLHGHTVWQRPTDTGRSTNCLINDVGIFVHRQRQGYHNYALPYSWDVRLGHKRREAAMEELDDDIDVSRVRQILAEIGHELPVAADRADQRLAAYYVSATGVGTAELRAHLTALLPEYMVPTYLVPLPEIPLTVNGKFDRKALPDPGVGRPELASAYVAPSTETEHQLAAIWRDMLRLPEVGVHDNFFDLGGDSVTSVRVAAAARRLGMALTARDVFAHHTIAELAQVIDGAAPSDERGGATDAPWESRVGPQDAARIVAQLGATASSIEDVYPLTPTQAGMLYHYLRSPDTATYFGQGTCTFAGPVDGGRLAEAWRLVCDRHPATRVRLLWSQLDTPVQVVLGDQPPAWQEHDWRDRSAEQVRADLDALLAAQRADGFDLAGDAPLMNFCLVHGPDVSHFVWNSHHAVLDGWSAHLVFREVLETYESLGVGDPPARLPVRPFRDHVEWLVHQDRDAAEGWWRAHLDGIEQPTPLPWRLDEPGSGRGHERAFVDLDADTSRAVTAFARQQRVTLSTVSTAVWGLVLAHQADVDDVVFGTTISGREDGVDGVQDMVGMLIATPPIRLRIDADQRVGPWLRSVQELAVDARSHGHLALTDIHRSTGVPPTQPLFDSIVVVENYPMSTPDSPSSLRPSPLEIGAPSNFAVALLIHPGELLRLEVVYDGDRVDPDAVARLLGHLGHTFASVVADAEQRVTDVEVLPAGERAVLRAYGRGEHRPPAAGLVHEVIARHADERPDAVAVTDPTVTLTYRQLVGRARQLVPHLRAAGVGRGRAVGVVTTGGATLTIGVLAILESGGVYVPLDPDLPAERLRDMVADTDMALVLTDGPVAVPGVPDVPVLDLGTVAFDDRVPEPVADPPRPEDTAYVIFTSGSTGRPKGVMVPHAGIAHSTSVRAAVYSGQVGVFLLLSSLAFDSSMVGLFWTLWDGGTLVIAPGELRTNVRDIADRIQTERVTHLLALPSLYGLLLDETAPDKLATLRTVIVAGEACPSSLAGRHHDRVGHAELFNEYGPTEASVWSHVHRVGPREGGRVPIGAPIPNSSCAVVDRFGHPAPVGVPGELVLGGPGIASGYLGRDDLTAAAFVTRPHRAAGPGDDRWYRTGDRVRWRADGLLEFLGRADGQVKVRGHRIELAEVEQALLDQPGVRAGAVVLLDVDDPDRRRLVACFTADGPSTLDAVRAALAARLPRFMVPAAYVCLDELPRTATGKVDRPALPAIAAGELARRSAVATPADRVEEAPATLAPLLAIFRELLGPSVGADDDFFERGGHSLLAIKLCARIERQMGERLAITSVFEAPTARSLAVLLRDRNPQLRAADTTRDDGAFAPSLLVTLRPGEPESPLPLYCVHPAGGHVFAYAPLVALLSSGQRVIGISEYGWGDPTERLASVEAYAARYVDEVIADRPEGPLALAGYSFGGLIAFEMARLLHARGREVSIVFLLDAVPAASPEDEPPISEPSTAKLRRRMARDGVLGVMGGLSRVVVRRWRGWFGDRATAMRDLRQLRAAERAGREADPLLLGRISEHAAVGLTRAYRPRRYDGRVVCFRATGTDPDFPLPDYSYRWHRVSTALEVIDVPGNHSAKESFLQQPHATVLGEAMCEILHATGVMSSMADVTHGR